MTNRTSPRDLAAKLVESDDDKESFKHHSNVIADMITGKDSYLANHNIDSEFLELTDLVDAAEKIKKLLLAIDHVATGQELTHQDRAAIASSAEVIKALQKYNDYELREAKAEVFPDPNSDQGIFREMLSANMDERKKANYIDGWNSESTEEYYMFKGKEKMLDSAEQIMADLAKSLGISPRHHGR